MLELEQFPIITSLWGECRAGTGKVCFLSSCCEGPCQGHARARGWPQLLSEFVFVASALHSPFFLLALCNALGKPWGAPPSTFGEEPCPLLHILIVPSFTSVWAKVLQSLLLHWPLAACVHCRECPRSPEARGPLPGFRADGTPCHGVANQDWASGTSPGQGQLHRYTQICRVPGPGPGSEVQWPRAVQCH